MITADALEKIREMAVEAAKATVTIDGKEYPASPLSEAPHRTRQPQLPEPLQVMGLQGIVDYCSLHPELRDKGEIVVEGWEDVSVYGPLDPEWMTRRQYVKADLAAVFTKDALVNKYHPHEQFMIFVMTNFVDSPERQRLLSFCGKVMQERVASSEDDGVSQVATVRQGASMKQQMEVKNPFNLSLYRTFREVIQPEATFILRLRGGGDQALQLALFEVSDETWKLEAVGAIKGWLDGNLDDWNIIG